MHDDVFLRGVKQTTAQHRLGFRIDDEGKHLGAPAAAEGLRRNGRPGLNGDIVRHQGGASRRRSGCT